MYNLDYFHNNDALKQNKVCSDNWIRYYDGKIWPCRLRHSYFSEALLSKIFSDKITSNFVKFIVNQIVEIISFVKNNNKKSKVYIEIHLFSTFEISY